MSFLQRREARLNKIPAFAGMNYKKNYGIFG